MHNTTLSQSAPPPLRLVFWESTARCNLACAHCRRLDVAAEAPADRARPGLLPDDLATAEAAALIDDCAAHHPQAIFVFSGGEPLLRPDLFELAARARGLGLTVALATNGTLIDGPLAPRIAAAGFSRVSISLDGARAETHDSLRRVAGSFESALGGLRLLRQAGQAVQINMSVTRHSAGELEAMFRLAEREGAAALHIFIVVPVGCGAELDAGTRLPSAEYERLLRQFYKLSAATGLATKATCAPQYARVTEQLRRQLSSGESAPPEPDHDHRAARDAPPEQRSQPAGHHPGRLDQQRGGCLAGSGVCFVSHRGEVFPCGYLPVSCGNIRQAPLSRIWRDSPVFAELRQPGLLKGHCGTCGWRAVCAGCRARAYAASGDYLAADPDCVCGT